VTIATGEVFSDAVIPDILVVEVNFKSRGSGG
jgi:hypothetical protein